MGTWGVGITSNDTVVDVISDFFDEYNRNVEIETIRKNLEQSYADLKDIPEEAHLFWFGLAKAQWDIDHLDSDVFEKVKNIYESGIDTKAWEELDGSKSDIRRREANVKEFVEKLKTTNPRPRKRKKIILRSSDYPLGTVIAFPYSEGDYGAFVVLTEDKDVQYPHNAAVILNIKEKNIPTMEDVIKSNIRIQASHGDLREEIDVGYYSYGLKRIKDKFTVIGRVKVKSILIQPHSYIAWFNLIPNEKAGLSDRKISLRKYLGYKFYEKIEIL